MQIKKRFPLDQGPSSSGILIPLQLNISQTKNVVV